MLPVRLVVRVFGPMSPRVFVPLARVGALYVFALLSALPPICSWCLHLRVTRRVDYIWHSHATSKAGFFRDFLVD